MKIKKIVKGVEGIEVRGCKDLEIMGLSSHSKFVHPKDLFIVKPSRNHKESEFVDEALRSGAIALVVDMYNPFLEGICQIVHPDPSSIEPMLAKNFYVHTNLIQKFLVTGTNGKTTSCFMLEHLLKFFGKKVGLLSTILKRMGDLESAASLTTDDLISNYRDLHIMTKEECSYAVIEVSSHGIEQNRVKGIMAQAVVFTNISHDHLDYHGSMQSYCEAKLKLLENLTPEGAAIYDLDCPILNKMEFGCKSLCFSLENSKADLFIVESNSTGVVLNFQGQQETLRFAFFGEHNYKNAMASILVLLHVGYNLKELSNAFNGFILPPGRLDEVRLTNGARVFIDFAHTPEALAATLKSLKNDTKGRLILVFGCGGNRDRGKRPLMTRSACSFCNHIIFTSDNPRNENPNSIIQDMQKGLSDFRDFSVIEDRLEAICTALGDLKKADTLCIAGKGHESSQIIGSRVMPFDDKNVVQKWIKDLDLVHV